jgi:indole-3-glycerol phosphate synthase
LKLQPQLVGINARDLEDFSVDTRIFARLYEQIPASALAVAESGIHAPQLVRELVGTGYRGFLIGESLLRSPDPAAMIRKLRQEGPDGAS